MTDTPQPPEEENPITPDTPSVPPPDDYFPPDEAAATAQDAPPPAEETPNPLAAPSQKHSDAVIYNIEAEEAVLGAILINPDAYYDVSDFLQADDFYIERNRKVWEAIDKLKREQRDLDLLTISATLESANELEHIGGQNYLLQLVNSVPSSLHIQEYARIVEASAIRRRLLTAASKIANKTQNLKLSVETLLTEAEKEIFNVSERRLKTTVQPIDAVLNEYFKELEERAKRDDDVVGVPTGFEVLDQILNGLQPSDLIIVAGRPGQGKTGLLLSIAKNAAFRYKKHVAMFSLEMSNLQLVQRLISQHTAIDSRNLRTGKLKDDEWVRFMDAVEKLSETRIFLDDTPAITPMQLRTKCRRLHMEHGLDLVLIDYLQLMGGDHRNDNRVQEVSYISRNLKILARELNVPIVAAAQLSRAVEQRNDKHPQLSDLRESGSLEQDADVVLFIYREEYYNKDTPNKNIAEIVIAKHRNGPTGDVRLFFRKNLTRFEDLNTYSANFQEDPL